MRSYDVWRFSIDCLMAAFPNGDPSVLLVDPAYCKCMSIMLSGCIPAMCEFLISTNALSKEDVVELAANRGLKYEETDLRPDWINEMWSK